MDNNNRKSSDAHQIAAQAAFDVLNTQYFKALCKPFETLNEDNIKDSKGVI
ncbi:MAG: hypothetical protein V3U57_08605 [Robiginitomaculum sp.]